MKVELTPSDIGILMELSATAYECNPTRYGECKRIHDSLKSQRSEEYFVLKSLEESHLEAKYRSQLHNHMLVNGFEVRWPKGKDFTVAMRDKQLEFFIPGGKWELIASEE